MKKANFIFLSLLLLFSCKKHNPEDPWYPHFKHLNERLEGEWELVKLYINGEDSSAYLDIDTMSIARFFKFEPTENISAVQGKGILYIKTKNMEDYPDQIGACSSNWATDTDSSQKSLTKLSYLFREGQKSGSNFFKLYYTETEETLSFPSGTVSFKPVNGIFDGFNNFYYRPFYSHSIRKATKKNFIIEGSTYKGSLVKRYRYEFKKIK